jgi:hypothetical protein
MFNPAEVEELAARKRLLAVESDLNRQALMSELSRLRASAEKVERVFRFGKSAYPLALATAPLAGYFLSSKAGPVTKILKSAVWGWQVVQRLKPFWDKWRRQSKPAEPDPPEPEILD